MTFIKSATEPNPPPDKAWFFIFSDNHILVNKKDVDQVTIPFLNYTHALESGLESVCYLGTYKNMACYCARAPENAPNRLLTDEFQMMNFRGLFGKTDFNFFWVAGYARQIFDWNMNFKFCGKCGTITDKDPNEHVRKCPSCDLISYPRISPAIIVAVIKENQILLARGINFPNKKMFSVLAGFVEAGETLEECVAREIFEETSIRVKKIRYFNSQPWPFPDSLMIGFTAQYDSGDIIVDQIEIAEANWFTAENLPTIPGKPSISRDLIDWFSIKDNNK